MKYTVKKDSKTGRFTSVTLTKSGGVSFARQGFSDHGVKAESLDRAKKAANSSLSALDSK